MERRQYGIALLLSLVCFAHSQIIEVRDGSCPPVEFQTNSLSSNSSSISHECYMDSSCPFSHKCCNSSDGAFRCTHPVFKPTTTMATSFVKNGRCPFRYLGYANACNTSYTCSSDSDCYSNWKCCPGFLDQDCSVCRSPVFDYHTTISPFTRKPYRYQPGTCPDNFRQYQRFDFDNDYGNCPNHCNETRDCDEGELCCVSGEDPHIIYNDYEWKRHASESKPSGCPVCKKADLGCRSEYGVYYQNKEIYSSDGCNLCQCFEGDTRCYSTCGPTDQGWGHHWHNKYSWIPAAILSSVSLLISVVVSLSLCCCMKCCCKGKKQPTVVPQPPALHVQAQQPPQYYYLAPATEDKTPLTNDDASTA